MQLNGLSTDNIIYVGQPSCRTSPRKKINRAHCSIMAQWVVPEKTYMYLSQKGNFCQPAKGEEKCLKMFKGEEICSIVRPRGYTN